MQECLGDIFEYLHVLFAPVILPVQGRNRYAQFVLEQAKQINPALNLRAREVRAVETAAFPTPARRPNNSRLNTEKLQQRFSLALPQWQAGVQRMLQEIL